MSSSREQPKRGSHDLSQFGLTEIPTDGFGNDRDLEAELAAVTGGADKPKSKPTIMATSELDRMVADSLKDVGSDDEEDVGGDDSDLLDELENIAGTDLEMETGVEETQSALTTEVGDMPSTPVYLPTTTLHTAGIVRQRIEMYKQAEAHAKAAGEAAKSRRLGRGLKTLLDLLKQANGGKTINVDDIPPEVSVKVPEKPTEEVTTPSTEESATPKLPTRAAAAPPPKETPGSPTAEEKSPDSVDGNIKSPTSGNGTMQNTVIEQMRTRQREYKASALQAECNGDTAGALEFRKVVDRFDTVIKMCEDGQEVDLSDMPPPPTEFIDFMAKMQTSDE